MSEHSYDPAFDDTRDSGRRAPPGSVPRVVEPVVETHVEPGSAGDDPGRTRLGVTLSRDQRGGWRRSRAGAVFRRRRWSAI